MAAHCFGEKKDETDRIAANGFGAGLGGTDKMVSQCYGAELRGPHTGRGYAHCFCAECRGKDREGAN